MSVERFWVFKWTTAESRGIIYTSVEWVCNFFAKSSLMRGQLVLCLKDSSCLISEYHKYPQVSRSVETSCTLWNGTQSVFFLFIEE